MHVSLNPTYYCNFRCPFCYLGDKLSDKTTISIDKVYERLTEITSHGQQIDSIDLYGGEILMLPTSYQEEIIQACRAFTNNIRVTTNLSGDYGVLLDYPVQVCVSYDHKARQDWKQVLQNIINFPKDLSVLMLASQKFINQDPNAVLSALNIRALDIEIKPYSTNQYNQQTVSHKDFEQCVKDYIQAIPKYNNLYLVNEDLIEHSLSGENNSFSDDHIYITPSGNFAVLDFDENDNEKFTELESFEDYKKWTVEEKYKMSANSYCMSCDYFGSCLSEHLREVKSLENSCSGYKGLLDWYKER
jgi:MoaA/NifB/PqqE/SkfB family radical SAM enzyme